MSIIENYPNSNLPQNGALSNIPSSINYNISNSIVISPINVYSPNKNLNNESENGNTVNMSTTQTSISYNDIAKEIGGGATVAATDVVSITITAIARSGSISSTPVTEVR